MVSVDFKKLIRDIPDFPQRGIIFRDISPLIQNNLYWRVALHRFEKKFAKCGVKKMVRVDARGFILAGAMADRLSTGVVNG